MKPGPNRNPDALIHKLFKFMNAHPKVSVGRLQREFRDMSKEGVRQYYYRWKREIETVRWLYSHMTSKWAPKLALTKKDKIVLRRIERMIGV